MKIFILLASLLFPLHSFSADSDTETKIKSTLHARSIQQVIEPKKVSAQIFTPYAVWFVRNNDIAASCALVDKENFNNILDMISPSDGQFGNCHQMLQEPIISYIDGNYYAIYTYVTEETRAELEKEYQLIKLTKIGFFKCKEDVSISEEIKKNVDKKKINLSLAAINAIKKFGCTKE